MGKVRVRSIGPYEVNLDETGLEIPRMRIWHEKGRVIRFVAQYETTIDDKRVPVVRYDTAHGFAHRDQLFRSRPTIKTPLPEHLPLNDALLLAERDIRVNWRTYRDQF